MTICLTSFPNLIDHDETDAVRVSFYEKNLLLASTICLNISQITFCQNEVFFIPTNFPQAPLIE